MGTSEKTLLPALILISISLALCAAPCQAEGPTLARLSFWLPPGRMAEFEGAYREQVLPILMRHGLVESSDRGRATVDSVFARLFQVKSASEVAVKANALQDDPAWQAVLRDVGTAFGTVTQDSLAR